MFKFVFFWAIPIFIPYSLLLFLGAVDQTIISRSMVTLNYTTSDGEHPIQMVISKEQALTEKLKKLLLNSPYIFEVCCLSYFCPFLSTSHKTCLLKSIDNGYQLPLHRRVWSGGGESRRSRYRALYALYAKVYFSTDTFQASTGCEGVGHRR